MNSYNKQVPEVNQSRTEAQNIIIYMIRRNKFNVRYKLTVVSGHWSAWSTTCDHKIKIQSTNL